MTDPDIIKECRQTGRTRTTTKNLLQKAYYEQMTEIQKVKAEIKMLEKKLSFLEELEKTKSPVEEAFKEFYGAYPITDIADTSWDSDGWIYFEAGYNAAYEEKVSQEPEEEPEELKTLYDVLRELDKPMFTDDVCSAVKRWMSQYTHNVMTGEYLKGYEECLTVLEENLKND